MAKKKPKKIYENWENIRIQKTTTKRLKFLKINMDMKTYDEVINYLADKDSK